MTKSRRQNFCNLLIPAVRGYSDSAVTFPTEVGISIKIPGRIPEIAILATDKELEDGTFKQLFRTRMNELFPQPSYA